VLEAEAAAEAGAEGPGRFSSQVQVEARRRVREMVRRGWDGGGGRMAS
jgi:hypothetical protein